MNKYTVIYDIKAVGLPAIEKVVVGLGDQLKTLVQVNDRQGIRFYTDGPDGELIPVAEPLAA